MPSELEKAWGGTVKVAAGSPILEYSLMTGYSITVKTKIPVWDGSQVKTITVATKELHAATVKAFLGTKSQSSRYLPTVIGLQTPVITDARVTMKPPHELWIYYEGTILYERPREVVEYLKDAGEAAGFKVREVG